GYVGGSVLSRLITHSGLQPAEISVLVRSEDKAKVLEKLGLVTIIGSYEDVNEVEKLASQVDVVFSCVSLSDNYPPAMNAILKGLKQRHVDTGTIPVLIHTSGTGIVANDDRGMSAPDVIYDDLHLEPIEKLPTDAPHRASDLLAVEADTEGYVRSYIILPGTVWGLASGPLVEANVQKAHSDQIPALVRASLDRRRGGMVGKGLAMKPNVSIEELADLFIVLYDAITENAQAVSHGREGYYFAENGEHRWYEISKEISRVLFSMGISQYDEPSAFTTQELVKYFGSEERGYGYGASSRCLAKRARQYGWKPVKSTHDMIKSIEEEVVTIVNKYSGLDKL
ncbi:NAD(P)-binding protein, partial [Trametopsis cervina]